MRICTPSLDRELWDIGRFLTRTGAGWIVRVGWLRLPLRIIIKTMTLLGMLWAPVVVLNSCPLTWVSTGPGWLHAVCWVLAGFFALVTLLWFAGLPRAAAEARRHNSVNLEGVAVGAGLLLAWAVFGLLQLVPPAAVQGSP